MTSDHGADQGSAGFDVLLRANRRAAGLTQAELASRAGVGVRTVRDLERGRASRPQRTTVELLARALDLTGQALTDFLAAARGPASAVEPPATASRLPPVGRLVGRDRDIADIAHLLSTGHGPVSLVGLGGVGKSSLALAVAHHVADRYPGGVAGVLTTDMSTESDTLTVIASVLGLARAEDLAGRFARAPALLLLDAVERAPEAAAGVLRWVARVSPDLHVLTTGRHPIGVPEERVWPVTPLEVPPADTPTDLATITRYPAAELFLARLRQVRREPLDAQEVGALISLVRRLGGLPLALELAAARGRVLDLNEILDRYGDRVLDLGHTAAPRDAVALTLRDAVAASYRLLDPAERYALRRLSVFRNRWSVELAESLLADDPGSGSAQPGLAGAEAGAGGGQGGFGSGPGGVGGGQDGIGGVHGGAGGGEAGVGGEAAAGAAHGQVGGGPGGVGGGQGGSALPGGDPVPLLDRLMALGLLSVRGTGPLRFRLLDVVRDFAGEQAALGGEVAAARRRHAAVFARLAAQAAPQLAGPDFAAAVSRLDDVASDLWAALAHSASDDPPTALFLASKLPRWWRFRGRDVSGRQWLRRLLDDPRTAGVDPRVRAWAQVGLAQLAQEHGAGRDELPAAEAALAEFQRLGHVTGELAARGVLCAIFMTVGGYDDARHHGEAVLEMASRTGRVREIAVAQNNLTWHEIRAGDLDAARRRLAAVDRLAAQSGENRLRALARANLAEVARLQGRYDEAESVGRRALPLQEELGDPGQRRRVLGTIGLAMAQAGRIEAAGRVLAELRSGAYPRDPSILVADAPALAVDPDPSIPPAASADSAGSAAGLARLRRGSNGAAGRTGGEDGPAAAIEARLALHREDRESAARWFAAAARAYSGGHDLRDVAEALVGLAACTDDGQARSGVLDWLASVCKEGGIVLLPDECALLADTPPAVEIPRQRRAADPLDADRDGPPRQS